MVIILLALADRLFCSQEDAIEAAKRDAQLAKDQTSTTATAVVSTTGTALTATGGKGGAAKIQASLTSVAVDEKAETEYKKMEAAFRKQLGLDGEQEEAK